jgi:hypothetical protein
MGAAFRNVVKEISLLNLDVLWSVTLRADEFRKNLAY